MTSSEPPYVFISYASADRVQVLPIVEALMRAGVAIWRDQESITGGTSYAPAIAAAIRGSSLHASRVRRVTDRVADI